jgi:hypothetical protein
MTQVQNHQEVTDLKVLLLKCFVAESDLACFLLDKANSTDLSVDDTFKLKHLADRVKTLVRQVQAFDDYHPKDSDDKRPPDKLPVYLEGGVSTPAYLLSLVVPRSSSLMGFGCITPNH